VPGLEFSLGLVTDGLAEKGWRYHFTRSFLDFWKVIGGLHLRVDVCVGGMLDLGRKDTVIYQNSTVLRCLFKTSTLLSCTF